jgi:hypothetical protein
MQIGTSPQVQPIANGAANVDGLVSTVLGIIVIVLLILWVTAPLWRKRFIAWLYRPFGAPKDGDI